MPRRHRGRDRNRMKRRQRDAVQEGETMGTDTEQGKERRGQPQQQQQQILVIRRILKGRERDSLHENGDRQRRDRR